MTEPRDPAAGNPEAQASKGQGSKAAANVPNANRDRLSDVVLYDDPAPAAGGAVPRSGSSTSPGQARPASAAATLPSGSAPSIATARTATPVPIAWRIWPVIDSVWELLGLSALLVAVPVLVWSLSGRTALTVASTAAVGLVMWRNFLPTICEMNALGVTQRIFGRTRRIPWLSIDRYVVGRRGVFLTSAGAPLELFRGLYLPWGSHRDQILASLRYYLPNAEDAN
ncbi:MAG: hypothetical protein K8U03_19835 [Planctomycetia bacterium]|nr:hypothetical protein [Planctomycetia bacterium]